MYAHDSQREHAAAIISTAAPHSFSPQDDFDLFMICQLAYTIACPTDSYRQLQQLDKRWVLSSGLTVASCAAGCCCRGRQGHLQQHEGLHPLHDQQQCG